MPCSNGAWRFLPLPDRAKHKQKKARNYAGLAAFHAIRCLAVPDAESFQMYALLLLQLMDHRKQVTRLGIPFRPEHPYETHARLLLL